MNELYNCEKKIKENILKLNRKNIFIENYVLLNKNWIEKYKKYYNYEYFLKNKEIESQTNSENIFIIKDLIPEFDDRPIECEDEKIKNLNCSLPHNFVLVSDNFIKLILNNFEDGKSNVNKLLLDNLIYEVIIGGKCIIIKDKHNKYSYFISSFKEPNINDNYNYNTSSINFLLRFGDKSKIETEIKLILSNGF